MYFGMALLAMVMMGCIPCVSLFLVGPVLGGIYYVVLLDMRGEAVDFGMLFKGFEKFVPLMVIGIIMSIPEIVGQGLRFTVDIGRLGLLGGQNGNADFYQSGPPELFAISSALMMLIAVIAIVVVIIAAVWRLLLFFAIPLALEHDLSPFEAIKLSIKAATSNVGGLIVLFIFEFLLALAGVLALCIGVFFVIPVIYAANAVAYRQAFPWVQRNFNTLPPPPGSYGSEFGRGM
jgi:hypothetical protein